MSLLMRDLEIHKGMNTNAELVSNWRTVGRKQPRSQVII